MDEFSKLASSEYPHHVLNMKMLMGLALAIHNPELKFAESDYYPFVQRLFRKDNLHELRNDISILTYNYDPYLDYVLREAWRHRAVLSNPKKQNNPQYPFLSKSVQEIIEPWRSKLCSGFTHPMGYEGHHWNEKDFNYFKLHGSISHAEHPNFGHEKLFESEAPARFGFLDDNWFNDFYVPPVVFPWEIFDSNSSNLILEQDFSFLKVAKGDPNKRSAQQLYKHYVLMWQMARIVVQNADKISFVGLSMHEYLEDGMKFLFNGFGTTGGNQNGRRRVELVVANPDNEYFKKFENRFHPASLCGKLSKMLMKIAPNMDYVRSASEFDGMFDSTTSPEKAEEPGITPRYSFKEFIEHEM